LASVGDFRDFGNKWDIFLGTSGTSGTCVVDIDWHLPNNISWTICAHGSYKIKNPRISTRV
jgi:hypothetical protein